MSTEQDAASPAAAVLERRLKAVRLRRKSAIGNHRYAEKRDFAQSSLATVRGLKLNAPQSFGKE
jgi:hypothetical protein